MGQKLETARWTDPWTNPSHRPYSEATEMRMEIPLPSWKWRGEAWLSVKEQAEFTAPEITVITYNVWFDNSNRNIRWEAILELCEDQKADFVCLQEVTVEVCKGMCESPFVRENYFVSDFDGRTIGSYGCLLLSRFPVRFYRYRLPTGMGRWLLAAEALGNGRRTCVATVHLESLNQAPRRREQLLLIAQRMSISNYEAMWLMGDFNFDSTRNFRKDDGNPLENLNIQDFFPGCDVWSNLWPDDPGPTFDTVRNKMLNKQTFECMRYDRILHGPVASPWKALEIKLLDQPIPGTDDKIWPSDHFGLLARFACVTKPAAKG